MNGTILSLRKCQIFDPQKGCFRVKPQRKQGQTYRGRPVFEDAFGVRFIVVDGGLP